MKTCNNCSALNELSVAKCTTCSMPGNFTLLHGHVEEEPMEETQNVQCMNCGNHQPSNHSHCSDCRFPLSRVKMKAIQKTTVQLYRKVG